jgi:hypothetical protein
MNIKRTQVGKLDNVYSTQLAWAFDGLVNNHDYEVDFEVESQNYSNGAGMVTDETRAFNVNYQTLKVKNKPLLTQLCDKSAIQVDWAGLYQNPGTITGTYSYLNNFLKYGNTALSLGTDGILTYNTTVIPANFTFSFMIKIPKTYNGTVFTTLNGGYQFGYNLSQQKFYTIINGVTTYNTEQTKITENPFYGTILPDHVVIRQYNIYNLLDNIKDLKLDDIANLPLDFMVQTNN